MEEQVLKQNDIHFLTGKHVQLSWQESDLYLHYPKIVIRNVEGEFQSIEVSSGESLEELLKELSYAATYLRV